MLIFKFALVHSIIKRHGGIVSVSSSETSGTTFTLYLTASVDAVVTGQDQEEDVLTRDNGRILIMDDDESIRDMLRQMLSMLGYEVVESANGEKSVALYRANMKAGTPFKLVIMDLTIPGGMGGKKAVQEVLKVDRNAKVVVSSGYSDAPIMANFEDYGFVVSVGKPFEFSQLSQTIHSVIVAS